MEVRFHLILSCVCACVYSAHKPVQGHVTTAPPTIQSRDPYWDESHDLHVSKEAASSSSASTTNNDQVMLWAGLQLYNIYLVHLLLLHNESNYMSSCG